MVPDKFRIEKLIKHKKEYVSAISKGIKLDKEFNAYELDYGEEKKIDELSFVMGDTAPGLSMLKDIGM